MLKISFSVTTSRPGLLHAWILLASCYLKLYIYNEAAQAVLKADKLLKSINNANQTLRKQLNTLLPEILSRHLEDDSLRRGIEISSEVSKESLLSKIYGQSVFNLLIKHCFLKSPFFEDL